MKKNFIYNSALSLMVVIGLGGCSDSKNAMVDNHLHTATTQTAIDASYNNWHNNIIKSQSALNSDKNRIETYYNTIRHFDKKSVTTSWLNDVATAMAKNPVYKKTILDAAGSDKLAFAQMVLKNPKSTISLLGASESLNTGLKHIEKYDYQYRMLSTAFEDSARGRTRKTVVNGKNINLVSLKQYTSKGNVPSVAEQLLTAAAVKILGLENNPTLKASYGTVLSNIPIENCLGNAQRNSAQCKAASYDKNDLSFCMAKHAIGETSQCFSWILP